MIQVWGFQSLGPQTAPETYKDSNGVLNRIREDVLHVIPVSGST